MRIAAVGDIHGEQNREAVRHELARLGPVDALLLAGDTTDHNNLDAYGAVLKTIREHVTAPIFAVFGNNEYQEDHPEYAARFAHTFRVRFLQDEAAVVGPADRPVRIVGSLGSLDRPTWWQRKNRPHLADEYRRRIDVIDNLLAGDGLHMLVTHYPPTYVTMGAEKDEWRPELGCRALEPILIRRRPALVIHGHIHKGIPFAELRPTSGRIEDFAEPAVSIPVHNVAFPVRHSVSTFDL
ncbi:MAG TPA: metallophosphoesterase [Thermoplasmata archaeon]|nr:metallophosphoesterase [Thermoplasmata archaeon]